MGFIDDIINGFIDGARADILKLVGFHGDMLDDPSGTVIETIERCAVVCPDVMGTPFVQSGYGTVADVALELFLTISVGMAIMYILNVLDSSNYEAYSQMIIIFKNSIIFIIGIKSCLFILQMAIVHNYELSMKFGGLSYVKDVILQPGIMEFGLFATGIGVMALFIIGCFYVVRTFLLYLSPFLIAIALVMWLLGKMGYVFDGWCEGFANFIMRFVVVNIYLGCVMVLVFGVATWFFKMSDEMSSFQWVLGGWGNDMIGVAIMIFITFIPFIAAVLIIWNPVPSLKKVIIYRKLI